MRKVSLRPMVKAAVYHWIDGQRQLFVAVPNTLLSGKLCRNKKQDDFVEYMIIL